MYHLSGNVTKKSMITYSSEDILKLVDYAVANRLKKWKITKSVWDDTKGESVDVVYCTCNNYRERINTPVFNHTYLKAFVNVNAPLIDYKVRDYQIGTGRIMFTMYDAESYNLFLHQMEKKKVVDIYLRSATDYTVGIAAKPDYPQFLIA